MDRISSQISRFPPPPLQDFDNKVCFFSTGLTHYEVDASVWIITHRIVNQVCALNVPLPFKPNSSISWVLCELYNVTSDHDTPALPVSVREAKFH